MGLAAAAVVVVLIVIGAGVFVLVGRESDDDTSASSTTESTSAATASPTSTPVTATTGDAPVLRTARLEAGVAVLRNEPAPNAAMIRTIKDSEGTDLAILEELDANEGWYRVRIGDNEGYLFGALLIPPTPGFCVGRSMGKPEVLDADGQRVRAGVSGSRVLMTDVTPTDGSWPVLLPGGERGFVAESSVNPTSCG